MTAQEKRSAYLFANAFLKNAGYNGIGRPRNEKVEKQVQAISTPCGGKPNRYKH